MRSTILSKTCLLIYSDIVTNIFPLFSSLLQFLTNGNVFLFHLFLFKGSLQTSNDLKTSDHVVWWNLNSSTITVDRWLWPSASHESMMFVTLYLCESTWLECLFKRSESCRLRFLLPGRVALCQHLAEGLVWATTCMRSSVVRVSNVTLWRFSPVKKETGDERFKQTLNHLLRSLKVL